MFLIPLFYVNKAEESPYTTNGLVLRLEEGVTGTYKKTRTFKMQRECVHLFPATTTLEDRYYENFDRLSQYTVRII
jgi:hypothetical protein